MIFGTIDSILYINELSELPYEKHIPKKQVAVRLRCMKKLKNYLYVAWDDKIIRVFNLSNFHLLEEFVGNEDIITNLEFADCMVSNDNSIRS